MLQGIQSIPAQTVRSNLCRACVAAAATLAVTMVATAPAQAGSGTAENPIVISPLTWRPTDMPVAAFKGTDGFYHLQYQLLFLNMSNTAAKVVDGDVLDPRTRQPTGHNQSISDDGFDIELKMRPFATTGEGHAAEFVDMMPAGQAGLMFFYLSYSTTAAIPMRLQHRFTAEQTRHDNITRSTATDAALTRVSIAQAAVIGPTMGGVGWLDGNGAGPSVYDHRMTLQPANGTAKPDQNFAIDWIKVDEQGHTFRGDPSKGDQYKNENFFAYGQPILSATDGHVASVEDDFPDQVPNRFEPVKQLKGLYGNYVIVSIGGGRYAVYAHLKPHSVTVTAGESVHVGQQLGELGNSGNSTAPHLHFQISDAPSIVDANSLPFVFKRMRYSERIVGPIYPVVDQMTLNNFAPKFDRADAGWRKLEMPLQGDVIDFPSPKKPFGGAK